MGRTGDTKELRNAFNPCLFEEEIYLFVQHNSRKVEAFRLLSIKLLGRTIRWLLWLVEC